MILRKCFLKLTSMLALIVFLLAGCAGAPVAGDDLQDNNSATTAQAAYKGTLTVFYPDYAMPSNYNPTRKMAEEAARIFTKTCGMEVEFYPCPSYEDMIDTSGTADFLLYKQKLAADIMAGRGPMFLLKTEHTICLTTSIKRSTPALLLT